jgi:hypothetical protein
MNPKEIAKQKDDFFEDKSVSIFEYKDFIRSFPYKKQSFLIERKNWSEITFNHLDAIFSTYGNDKMIRLNREMLFEDSESTEEFIFKVLLWGYPTKGRGNNIKILLEKENLEELKIILEKYKNNNVSTEELVEDVSKIKGLGISTVSKFLYFLNAKIDGFKALILDDQILNVINRKRISELNQLSSLKREKALKKYSKYLEKMSELSKELECEPDQIEIFLFSFGKNVS